MPNWKTHIEIGKRLNTYLKYEKEELDLFLFGTILPDINNCYLVTNISEKIQHSITHMGSFINPSYVDFYNKYKSEIDNKNPVFLGYLSHLYTDYSFNNDFYTSIEKSSVEKDNREKLRIMKQSDFKIYNNKFIRNNIELKSNDILLNEIKKIDEVSVNKEDILKIIDFLQNEKEYDEKLKFYTIGELDKLTNNTVNECIGLINSIMK